MADGIFEIKTAVKELFPDFPNVAIKFEKSMKKGYTIRERDGIYTVQYHCKNDCFRGVTLLFDKIKKMIRDFYFQRSTNSNTAVLW